MHRVNTWATMTDTSEQGTTPEPSMAEPVETAATAAGTEAGQGNPQSDPQQADRPVTDEARPKRKAGIEQRMSELTAKRKEAERRADEAERKLAEATAGNGGQEQSEKAPSLDDFQTYDDYVDARAKWIARQEYKAVQRESAEASRKSADETRKSALQEAFAAQVEDARSRMADFDAVVFSSQIPITAAVQDAILESDMSADVAYYLGKNPEVAARLLHLPAMAVAREIGRIEAALLSTPVVVKATQAPDPIKPVGQRSAVVQKNPDEMTEQEYWAWRKAQKSQR